MSWALEDEQVVETKLESVLLDQPQSRSREEMNGLPAAISTRLS